MAAICKAYGLGRPEWRVNVFPHRDFQATSCPGPLREGTSYHNRYMARAQQWYDAMVAGTEPGEAAGRHGRRRGRTRARASAALPLHGSLPPRAHRTVLSGEEVAHYEFNQRVRLNYYGTLSPTGYVLGPLHGTLGQPPLHRRGQGNRQGGATTTS